MTDEHSHNQNMLLKCAKVMRIQHFNVSSYFNIYVCEVQLTANVPILNRDSLCTGPHQQHAPCFQHPCGKLIN